MAGPQVFGRRLGGSHEHSGTADGGDELRPGAVLGLPEYSSDGDAPDGTLFLNTTSGNLRYKNVAGATSPVGGAEGASFALGIPTTTLADTEFLTNRYRVASGNTLEIYAVGVQNSSNNVPGGLTFEVDDETNTTNLLSQSSKRATGDPLASVDGPVDVAFTIENDTTATQEVSGYVEFSVS